MDRETNTALLALDGDDLLRALTPERIARYRYVLAADGALARLEAAGIRPHAVAGDLDGVDGEKLAAFREAGGLVDDRSADQETTDLEKGLLHLREAGYVTVDIAGYHGDRYDHMLALLHGVLMHGEGLSLRLLDTAAEGWVLRGPEQRGIDSARGRVCSLIPLLPCEGVVLEGFQWPLHGERLAPGERISCSNRIDADHAVVRLETGALLVYLHYPARED